ncbi:PREDICTED: DEAD-box ATP-dependent RNA helicase 52 [Theobroma cacao]|uniref:RNA helicase n=1 Tax=Theobroma cacao TaxID=3641 RepID=A0AB32UQ48_THECC|nr:PREDICTED: DEAD-box ATP-dependent RNA helicase 52 [Theobroma cacao]
MTRNDMFTESTRKQTRPSRPRYLPPHLRHQNANAVFTDADTPELTRPRYNRFSLPQTARNSGGRGRGRGPSFTNRQKPNLDDEKFDELEVIDDTAEGTNETNFGAYEDIPVQASGENIPPPVQTFAEIDLGHVLKQNIKRCKFLKPTPIQRHAIPIVIAGRDLMACAQTGSGKTAAFCFPIICGVLKDRLLLSIPGGSQVACPLALILAPTRELSCQTHEEAKKFAYRTGVKIVVAYGGTPISQQFRNIEKGVDILVATPGRLVDMIERARVSLRMIKYLALDEADRMLDMGFEPQIRKIVEKMDMPPPGTRQTMLFSATFPDEIQKLASDFLSDYVFLAVGRVGSSTDLIVQRVEIVQDMDKRNHLLNLLHAQKYNGSRSKHPLTLVFVETKRGADELEHWLSRNGFPAIAIHGGKVQMERELALRSFKSGATPILVATDVASRGLDIPHVAHVINFDLPKNIDDYVHRIGRTGRAGNCGLATAFFSDKNLPLAKSLAELMRESNQEVPSWLNQYAENSSFSGGGWAKRVGGKFGGYDFRKGFPSGNENNYHSSTYNYTHPVSATGDYYAAASANAQTFLGSAGIYADPCTTSANADYLVGRNENLDGAGPREYAYSHGQVVASGWE